MSTCCGAIGKELFGDFDLNFADIWFDIWLNVDICDWGYAPLLLGVVTNWTLCFFSLNINCILVGRWKVFAVIMKALLAELTKVRPPPSSQSLPWQRQFQCVMPRFATFWMFPGCCVDFIESFLVRLAPLNSFVWAKLWRCQIPQQRLTETVFDV